TSKRRVSEAMTRPRSVVQTLVLLIAVVVMSSALTVLGCGGDKKFTGATANDLANRAYTFPTGAGALLARASSLPPGQPFTLQFGNFGGTNSGPVRLESGGSSASGTVTIGSCIFQFNQSTFPAGRGPQVGTLFTSNPCEVDRTHNTMRLTPVAGETEVS